MSEYWICTIGPVERSELQDGADFPMRMAVREAFTSVVGRGEESCASGWGNTEKNAMATIQKLRAALQQAREALLAYAEHENKMGRSWAYAVNLRRAALAAIDAVLEAKS